MNRWAILGRPCGTGREYSPKASLPPGPDGGIYSTENSEEPSQARREVLAGLLGSLTLGSLSLGLASETSQNEKGMAQLQAGTAQLEMATSRNGMGNSPPDRRVEHSTGRAWHPMPGSPGMEPGIPRAEWGMPEKSNLSRGVLRRAPKVTVTRLAGEEGFVAPKWVLPTSPVILAPKEAGNRVVRPASLVPFLGVGRTYWIAPALSSPP